MSDQPKNAAFVTAGPYAVLHDFLGHEANARVLSYAMRNRQAFEPSLVFRKGESDIPDNDFRISTSMVPEDAIQALMRQAIDAALPAINDALVQPDFVPTDYEFEMAAHNNGAFFKTHIDTATGRNRQGRVARITSAVYYFFREPAGFSGGELRLRSIAPAAAGGSHINIAPRNDMLLVFPSWLPHEVLPVSCPGGDFADSRFAINCWLAK